MSEGGGTTRCRGSSPAPPASLPDDDDILREIILRLPPQPSSLPHASAVWKRWRRLVTDRKFLQCFCAHHGKPPLLGFFGYLDDFVFTPILDPPDRIPPERFSLRSCSSRHHNDVLGCRHGLVLVKCRSRKEVVVCEPISGEQRRVAVPPEFKRCCFDRAVFCAAGDQDHVHGGCHLSPFKVVLVSMCRQDNRPVARVYSSEPGIWGNLISTAAPCVLFNMGSPATLVGNVLFWLNTINCMLEFDLDGQSLSMITGPPVTDDFSHSSRQIIQVEDGDMMLAWSCFLTLASKFGRGRSIAMVLPPGCCARLFDMHNILGLPPQLALRARGMETILGYAEDTDAIFIYVDSNVYMVQLIKSMQVKRLHENYYFEYYHPFGAFYAPGIANAGGCDGAVLLHAPLI